MNSTNKTNERHTVMDKIKEATEKEFPMEDVDLNNDEEFSIVANQRGGFQIGFYKGYTSQDAELTALQEENKKLNARITELEAAYIEAFNADRYTFDKKDFTFDSSEANICIIRRPKKQLAEQALKTQ